MGNHKLMRMFMSLPLTFLFAVFILFTACSSLPNDVSQTGNNEKVSSSGSVSSPASTDFTNPQKLQKTVSSKLSADATVEVPQAFSSGYVDTLNAKLMFFTPKDVKDSFILNNQKIINKQGVTFSKQTNYFGEKVEQFQDVTNDGTVINNQSGVGICYAKPFANNLNLFITDETSTRRNADKFDTSSQLPFESRQNAFEKIKTKLASLGISVSPNYTCYSLDHKTMQEEEQKYIKFVKTLSPKMQEIDNYKSIGNWTEQQDSYCFILSAVLNDAPLTAEDHGTASGGTVVMGSKVKVFYDQDGIVSLFVHSIYAKDSMNQTHQKLMTAESALEKLADYYKDVITSDKFTATNIQLEYVATVVNKDRTNFVIVPAWRFDLKTVGVNSSVTNKMFVNAVSGEIIK